MKLRTVTWNIGGGKLLQDNADPTLLASYTKDGIDEIVAHLKSIDPDVITLQETQRNANNDQIAYIAENLGYKYFLHDSTSDSHIDKGHQLGHGIISRYPLTDHQTGFFDNPRVQVEWEDGSIATSFDKGYTTCRVTAKNTSFSLTTLHLIPFRRFNIEMDSDLAKSILRNVAETLSSPTRKWIIQGDFNIDSETLKEYMPELFEQELDEVSVAEPTTPKNHRYDHVLFRSMTLTSLHINPDVLTDHFPVIAEFEVSEV